MSRVFMPPVNVSPLIKFGRWSLLVLGVSYGTTRHHFLQNKEDKTKEVRHNLKIEKETKIAEEKKKFAEEEMKHLNSIFNPVKTA